MTQYTIMINEQQRALIQEALFHHTALPQPTKEEHEELVILFDLFRELPKQENTYTKTEHMVHGFCL